MDVPFLSSNALSRTQYVLVRKVENAGSIQAVDDILLAEIDIIRGRLRQSSLSMKECKECLVLLLYCAMTTTTPVTDLGLSFALPHAINLAEAGVSVPYKRIGYLFCTEMMPQGHSQQLLLVNTLRKDLDSDSVARVCLALDTMIQSPFEDVIPAVQDRLYDILSHNSVHVRRRALLALRALSKEQPDLIKPVIPKVQKRLEDSETAVVSAALIVVTDLVKSAQISASSLSTELNELISFCWTSRSEVSHVAVMTRAIMALRSFGISPSEPKLLHKILRFSSRQAAVLPALLLESILLLYSNNTLQLSNSTSSSPVTHIRHLLTSEDPNEQYLFLCVLESLDPRLWAGTVPEHPAVLDGWEVERIMQSLDSLDGLIRSKTLRILLHVDASILESYFSRMLDSQSSAIDGDAQAEYALRLLQVAEILSGDDGELYARYLKRILESLDGGNRETLRLYQEVVERILVYVRNAKSTFKIGCTTVLLTPITEQDVEISPVFVLISAALVCEYLYITSLPPPSLLRGFANRLTMSPASIKEACLLAMLRVAAECEDIPGEVSAKVKKAREVSGKYLARRYRQFTSLTSQKSVLKTIVSKAKSSSLPDFVISLESYETHPSEPEASSPGVPSPLSLNRSLPNPSSLTSKLRYTAYERPRPSSKRRSRSSVSDAGSSRLSVDSYRTEDSMSKTVTAGELALMATGGELESVSRSSPRPRDTKKSLPALDTSADINETASRVDLIALDSPFISDPVTREGDHEQNLDFQLAWDAYESSNSRGWCELSVDNVVRKLQTMKFKLQVIAPDETPFPGELKIITTQDGSTALLRLRESDDDETCLWRLRSEDETLCLKIKRLLVVG